jgi:hypothetical protein
LKSGQCLLFRSLITGKTLLSRCGVPKFGGIGINLLLTMFFQASGGTFASPARGLNALDFAFIGNCPAGWPETPNAAKAAGHSLAPLLGKRISRSHRNGGNGGRGKLRHSIEGGGERSSFGFVRCRLSEPASPVHARMEAGPSPADAGRPRGSLARMIAAEPTRRQRITASSSRRHGRRYRRPAAPWCES